MTPKDFIAGHVTRAVARPIPGAHNIAELVAHLSVWAAIAERRLVGENANATDEENFPTFSQLTDETTGGGARRLSRRTDRLAQEDGTARLRLIQYAAIAVTPIKRTQKPQPPT